MEITKNIYYHFFQLNCNYILTQYRFCIRPGANKIVVVVVVGQNNA